MLGKVHVQLVPWAMLSRTELGVLPILSDSSSAATRGSGVLSPKVLVRQGRLVSRRLPLALALALERVLVGSEI